MFGKEPAVILGALSEVIRAVIPTLIIFGFISWTGEQVAQVMLLVGVVIAFLNIALTRSQVVPIVVADKQIEVAKASSVSRSNQSIIDEAKETA
jgi:hypothetical protein